MIVAVTIVVILLEVFHHIVIPIVVTHQVVVLVTVATAVQVVLQTQVLGDIL